MNNIDLRFLIGLELVSVTFVRDYIQITLDGPSVLGPVLISIINDLRVADGPDYFILSSPGFRDVLCSAINRSVTNVHYSEHVDISITLQGDLVLRIGLSDDDYKYGPEGIHISMGAQLWIF